MPPSHWLTRRSETKPDHDRPVLEGVWSRLHAPILNLQKPTRFSWCRKIQSETDVPTESIAGVGVRGVVSDERIAAVVRERLAVEAGRVEGLREAHMGVGDA